MFFKNVRENVHELCKHKYTINCFQMMVQSNCLLLDLITEFFENNLRSLFCGDRSKNLWILSGHWMKYNVFVSDGWVKDQKSWEMFMNMFMNSVHEQDIFVHWRKKNIFLCSWTKITCSWTLFMNMHFVVHEQEFCSWTFWIVWFGNIQLKICSLNNKMFMNNSIHLENLHVNEHVHEFCSWTMFCKWMNEK